MPGIVSYGTYIPQYRIKIADITRIWKREDVQVALSLGVKEKAVAGIDEDTVTMATQASTIALSASGLQPQQIEATLIGSESHPYVVKPSSTIVSALLGMHGGYFAADLEFACKAATASMLLIQSLIQAGKIHYGLAIGSDTGQAKPGDILECTAGSAAAAYILGKKNVLAEIDDSVSFSTDTPDFWRRDGQRYPSHAARFTGEPSYFTHVETASKHLLEKISKSPQDFDYCVFHMPNCKFPKSVAKKLGFTRKQIAPGFLVEQIGNPYSASSLMGFAATLDVAKPGQKIFLCSYGSGAGSDAIAFTVTDAIISYRKNQKSTVKNQLARKEYIDYMEVFQRQAIRNS